MRILHVLDHSLPMHSGYTFRTRAILKAQIAMGWHVAGVTGLRHSEDYAALSETHDGLQFFRTPGQASGPSPLREWREVSHLTQRIEKLVEQWHPDILHAHSPALNGLAALRASQRTGVPLLYEIRAFWEDAAVGNGAGSEGSTRYWLTRQLENRVVAGADAVAVISNGLRNDLLARGVAEDKITVSPNGVDMGLFGTPATRDTALAEAWGLTGKPVIGFVGSFYDYEGLGDLIAAMPALVEAVPGLTLMLVGGGPMESRLRAQADRSPAHDAIHFAGRVPHEEVERYYALMDVLVYPRKAMRLTELVTPLKPLEAMAQGRLVAASAVGGHCELIEDGVTGTLFPPDNPDALSEALAAMFHNRESWNHRRTVAREFVAKDRNWTVNIQRYQPVYQKLLTLRSDAQSIRAA